MTYEIVQTIDGANARIVATTKNLADAEHIARKLDQHSMLFSYTFRVKAPR